jgi:hypothetical protein
MTLQVQVTTSADGYVCGVAILGTSPIETNMELGIGSGGSHCLVGCLATEPIGSARGRKGVTCAIEERGFGFFRLRYSMRLFFSYN